MINRRSLMKALPLGCVRAISPTSRVIDGQRDSAQRILNVRDYGAIGDGRAVDTNAINCAIAEAAAAGGGTVWFPGGTYVCFTLRMKSNVELHLSQGCTVLAADSPTPGDHTGYNGGTYDHAEPNPGAEQYQDFGHSHWRNSLIVAEDEHDFSITGPGLIFGKGLSHGMEGSRGGYKVFVAEQAGVGNKSLAFKNCHNVLLRDFKILKGGHFAILATGVDNLTIDNLIIDTDRDGIDIDCCHNVRVSNCTINSPWDDAICPKSSYALGYRRTTNNVTISNNYVTGGYELGSVLEGTWKPVAYGNSIIREGRIKCGTESNGGFCNITITGNTIENCKGIALESSDGAYVEDIVIADNVMRDLVDAPLFLCLNRRYRNPAETKRPGAIRRILITNLVSSNSNASTACILSGIPSNQIEDVKISNCNFEHQGLPKMIHVEWSSRFIPMPNWKQIQVPEREQEYPELLEFGPTPCHGFFIRHMKKIEMNHVEIASKNPDPRPAFWLQDVQRADFFAITAPAQKNFSLHHIRDFRIEGSRASPAASLSSEEDFLL